MKFSSKVGGLPLEAVVREYESLKGLLLLPTGLGMAVGAGLASALLWGGWESGSAALLACVVGLMIQGVGTWWFATWYDNHLGSARAARWDMVLPGVVAALCVPLILLSMGHDFFSGWPVLLAPPVLAGLLLLLLLHQLRRSGLTRGHLVACGLLGLSGLLPAVVPVASGHRITLTFLATGLTVIVIGLLDHRRLLASVSWSGWQAV